MRLIYCPSEEFLDEALNLAESTKLQIVVGENAFTKTIEFDRSIVQVVSEHKDEMLHYLPKSTVSMCHAVMCYSSKMLDFSTAECCYVFSEGDDSAIGVHTLISQPYFCERGYVRFLTRLPVSGTWHFVVRMNGQDIVDGEVEVHETGRYRTSGPRGFAIQKYF